MKAPTKPYCSKCDRGWLRVEDPVARKLYNNQTATAMLRCDCRRGEKYWQHEKALEAWKPPRTRPAQ